jgi:hypothetical protein
MSEPIRKRYNVRGCVGSGWGAGAETAGGRAKREPIGHPWAKSALPDHSWSVPSIAPRYAVEMPKKAEMEGFLRQLGKEVAS